VDRRRLPCCTETENNVLDRHSLAPISLGQVFSVSGLILQTPKPEREVKTERIHLYFYTPSSARKGEVLLVRNGQRKTTGTTAASQAGFFTILMASQQKNLSEVEEAHRDGGGGHYLTLRTWKESVRGFTTGHFGEGFNLKRTQESP